MALDGSIRFEVELKTHLHPACPRVVEMENAKFSGHGITPCNSFGHLRVRVRFSVIENIREKSTMRRVG